MSIIMEKVTVTTTGSAGSATGSATTKTYDGRLVAIYMDFSASAPGTTDTTVALANTGGNLLVVSNSATDAWFAPRLTCVNNANSAITNSFDMFPVNQPISITLAQCDALAAALVAYVFIEV